MSALTPFEREHIIRWSEEDDPAKDRPNFFTHNERWARKLVKAGGEMHSVSRLKGKAVAWCVLIPREWIRLPLARKKNLNAKGNPEALEKARAAAKSQRKSLTSEKE